MILFLPSRIRKVMRLIILTNSKSRKIIIKEATNLYLASKNEWLLLFL